MKPSLDLLQSPSSQQLPATNRQLPLSMGESYQKRHQTVAITLTTLEGDTVTLSQQSSSTRYRQESLTSDTYRLSEKAVGLDSMSIAVQGDLNQQELDDLARLFDDLGAIANNFFTGHLEEAVNGAMIIGDMGTISSLEATFTQSSILSSHLAGPHPMPSSLPGSDALIYPSLDSKLPDSANASPVPAPSPIDITSAQWRQFLHNVRREPTTGSPPSSAPPTHQHRTAKDMLERAKETLATNPRLMPLLPSIATLAVNRTAEKYHPPETATLLAQSTIAKFNTLLADWVL